MKILVSVPCSASLVLNVKSENIGTLLCALADAKAVQEEGYGKDRKWTYDPKPIECKFLPPDFDVEITDPVKQLLEEKENTTKQWLEAYTRANKAEADLKALRDDLTQRGITFLSTSTL